MKKLGLDATDIRILSAVQQHGQLSKTRLAELVNLSPTPCWARLDRIMAAGMKHGLKPGHTSSIRRIEGGMLSYHADADITTNPYELGFDRLVNLDMEADFIGKAALRRIKEEGPARKQVGLVIECDPLAGPNTTFWTINQDGTEIGKVTSAVYSPRLEKNIALAMVAVDATVLGAEVEVVNKSGPTRAIVVERPFYDPKKQIAAA